ncbi:MAG: hypothetical protein H5U02_05995 [Clostridia bacterium]|nr:hypothetical protein [Clostridia bacterium]
MAVDRLLEEIGKLSARERAELFRKLGVEPREGKPGKGKKRKAGGFDPIGFGMWEHRPEFNDAAAWVDKLRREEWDR